MTAIANVSLVDTFDTWRLRTNQLIVATDQLYTLTLSTSQNLTVGLSDTVNTSMTYSMVYANNTANSLRAYTNTTTNVVSGNARAAFIQANAAYDRANTKLSAVEGTAGRITTTANGTYSYFVDLATSGAGAAAYTGGISAITVDAYGRVSSVAGSANYQPALGFTPVRQGGVAGQGANTVYIGWTNASTKLGLQVDSTSYGTTWPIDITGLAPTSTLATKASTLSQGGGNGTAMTFTYTPQTGQPTYVWGTNDGVSALVWNPSNFSVNYANWAGYFDNGNIYLTGNQVNSGKSSAVNDTELAINFAGFNNANTYRRTATVYNGQNLPIGRFLGSDRSFYCWGNITAYFTSDKTLKTNIKPITKALDKVSKIRGVEFDWTEEYLKNSLSDPYFTRKHDVGVIAQEIEKVLPEVVSTRDDGLKAVKYDRIIPLLIEAIKELKKEVEKLKEDK